jgi:haloalkane dehalogenase
MHYVDEGRGDDAILLAHGTPRAIVAWRPITSASVSPTVPRPFAYTPEAHAAALAEFVDRLGLDRFTLVVHDFGGPIGLPLALRSPSPVQRLVILNSFAWPIDDDPKLARGARLLGGAAGRLLYRYANVSQRLIMPAAYGDKRKLTPAIRRQYGAASALLRWK